jgi:hypothetical protein
MKNIFDDGRTIEEGNFLDYDIKKLLNQGQDTFFDAAIERLEDIRETLLVAKKIGRLESIANRGHYLEVLRWLKGELPLSNWHYVPQINSIIDPISQGITQDFNTHTQQLLINLQSEPTYSAIEVSRKALPVIKSTPITKRVEESLADAKASLDEVNSKHFADLDGKINQANNDIQNTLNNAQNAAAQLVEQIRNNASMAIDSQVVSAVSQLKQAVALSDWGEVYDRDIEELRYKLYGKNLKGVIGRNLSSLRNKFRGLKLLGFKNINWWKLMLTISFLLIKNITSLIGAFASMCLSLAWRRTASFLLLTIVAGVVVAVPLLSLFGAIHTSIFNPTNPQEWLAKVLLWLPAIIVVSIGYSFITKNYRIYCNMLDQYRHRRAVAKTAQGIIMNVGSTPQNEDVRNAMTVAAATALFEHKVTGHLSKKEIESLGVLDVLKSVKS